MNNRFLFRGKTIECVRPHFVMGHYVSVPRPMIVSDKPKIGGGWDFDDVDPATVGQCTSFPLWCNRSTAKISDTKVLYEGDIVGVYSLKWDDDGEYERDELVATFEVRWNKEWAAWDIEWLTGGIGEINEKCDTGIPDEYDLTLAYFVEHFENTKPHFGEMDVIGTIHDPELLGGEA